jgi:DNA-binding transcriptional MerR regulator
MVMSGASFSTRSGSVSGTVRQELSSADEETASYRPVDLARTVGLSPSQIRNYERDGFLPPSHRTTSGHRRYNDSHVAALQVSRCLIDGFGWQSAREAMSSVHAGRAADALAVADGRHAVIKDQRMQVAEALAALDATRKQIRVLSGLSFYQGRTVAIGEAAKAIGVNSSAIRYWESRGVLAPGRTANDRRAFDLRLLQQLQLIKILRDINYNFDSIRSVVNDLDNPTNAKAKAALEERSRRIDQASRKCAKATGALIKYIEAREN